MKIPDHINSKIRESYLRQSQATQRKGTTRRVHTRRLGSKSARTSISGLPPRTRGVRGFPGPGNPRDEIVLSPRATELRQFQGVVKAIPEVRQEKVEAVKRQIESRTYTVDGKLVAKSIADLLRL